MSGSVQQCGSLELITSSHSNENNSRNGAGDIRKIATLQTAQKIQGKKLPLRDYWKS